MQFYERQDIPRFHLFLIPWTCLAVDISADARICTVDAAEAKGIKIPLCMLASKDEDGEAVKKFEAELTGPKHVETFSDQIHG